MGEEYLVNIFFERRIEDLTKAFLTRGINGIMDEFEFWLRQHQLIDFEQEKNFREMIEKEKVQGNGVVSATNW